MPKPTGDFDGDSSSSQRQIGMPNAKFLFASDDQSVQNGHGSQQSDGNDDLSQFPSQPRPVRPLSPSAASFPGRPRQTARKTLPVKSNSGGGRDEASLFGNGDRSVQEQLTQLRQDAFPSFGDMAGSGGASGDGRRWSGFGDSQQESQNSQQVMDAGGGGVGGQQQQSDSTGGADQAGAASQPERSVEPFSGDMHDEEHEHDQPASNNFDYQRFYVGIW